MNKEFVPYEQASELKKLGFFTEERIFGHFMQPFLIHLLNHEAIFLETSTIKPGSFEMIQAPTYSQAFRWFREKYNLHHSIDNSILGYYGLIRERDSNSSLYISEWVNTEQNPYKTHEEAELACLKKLIEITKNK